MPKIVFESTVPPNALSSLLEGYLSGLSEVCHTLFGAKGEAVMYEAVGDEFKKYLKKRKGIEFTRPGPWERYCEVIEFFTAQGFYSHVELEEIGGGRYWMLESGQYAGNVWEEQKSWERGTPPCPLWAIVVRTQTEIGYRVVLDEVKFRADMNGYESTFHFEKFDAGSEGMLERAIRVIRESIFATSLLNKVADSTTDVIFLKDLRGRYLFANNAASRLMNAPVAMILGKDDTALLAPDAAALIRNNDQEVVRYGGVLTYEEAVASEGITRTYSTTKGVLRDADGKPTGLFGISRDITEGKRMELISTARLHLIQFAATHTLEELLEETLNTAEEITGSLIGFCHFCDTNLSAVTLRAWSTRTRGELCRAEGHDRHSSIQDAGVWADAARQARPLIHNDYASLARPKDLPKGHPAIIREMVVPVIRGNAVQAILGVGNKSSDYTDKDVESVSHFADFAWDVALRKKAEMDILKLNQELDQRVQERTVELERKNAELQRMNKLFVGRELRMVELKERIVELEARAVPRNAES
jgi:PAS domain S-box-containing protein